MSSSEGGKEDLCGEEEDSSSELTTSHEAANAVSDLPHSPKVHFAICSPAQTIFENFLLVSMQFLNTRMSAGPVWKVQAH